ncbi:MAG: hypothetical protein OHK0037_17340 [Elainellaceae cyanobacterium]
MGGRWRGNLYPGKQAPSERFPVKWEYFGESALWVFTHLLCLCGIGSETGSIAWVATQRCAPIWLCGGR